MNSQSFQQPYGIRGRRINFLAPLFIALICLFIPYRGAFGEDNGRGRGDIIVFALGDSLTAGFGLAPGDGFPAQLEAALRDSGLAATVVDAGVSGDTTSSGRARLVWVLDSLPRTPDLAIVELGGNDALRGIEPALTKTNLAAIVETLQARDVPVLIAGMLAPPNLGRDYGDEFNAIFPTLAKAYDTAYYPFFLDGVAADVDLNQADGIHPTREGVAIIVRRMLPTILAALPGALSER